jgi:hypothetical protein
VVLEARTIREHRPMIEAQKYQDRIFQPQMNAGTKAEGLAAADAFAVQFCLCSRSSAYICVHLRFVFDSG